MNVIHVSICFHLLSFTTILVSKETWKERRFKSIAARIMNKLFQNGGKVQARKLQMTNRARRSPYYKNDLIIMAELN